MMALLFLQCHHLYFYTKGRFTIVRITKNEKEQILARYPDAHITRTMKQDSKRHHYYMVEERWLINLLKVIRGEASYESDKINVNASSDTMSYYNNEINW